MFGRCRECGKKHLVFRCGGKILDQRGGIVDLDDCFYPSINEEDGPLAVDPTLSAASAILRSRIWTVIRSSGEEELWTVLLNGSGDPVWHLLS